MTMRVDAPWKISGLYRAQERHTSLTNTRGVTATFFRLLRTKTGKHQMLTTLSLDNKLCKARWCFSIYLPNLPVNWADQTVILCIGYRLRWRSDIWSTNRGAAEVGTPDIRPTTEDDIRHNATTQDKDLLRIIMPFCFRFYFHYRMLRKKAKQPFEASSLKFF